jgi:hypothetical protein
MGGKVRFWDGNGVCVRPALLPALTSTPPAPLPAHRLPATRTHAPHAPSVRPPTHTHTTQVDVVKGDWCDPQKLDMQNVTTAFAGSLNKTGRDMWFNFHCRGTVRRGGKEVEAQERRGGVCALALSQSVRFPPLRAAAPLAPAVGRLVRGGGRLVARVDGPPRQLVLGRPGAPGAREGGREGGTREGVGGSERRTQRPCVTSRHQRITRCHLPPPSTPPPPLPPSAPQVGTIEVIEGLAGVGVHAGLQPDGQTIWWPGACGRRERRSGWGRECAASACPLRGSVHRTQVAPP